MDKVEIDNICIQQGLQKKLDDPAISSNFDLTVDDICTLSNSPLTLNILGFKHHAAETERTIKAERYNCNIKKGTQKLQNH